MTFIRPSLGLIQGLISYWIVFYSNFSVPGMIAAILILNFPLFALQVKLPSKNTLPLGLTILGAMALIYGFAAYSLMSDINHNFFNIVLAYQCSISAFIIFVFYCVAVERGRLCFPYSSLFSEAWQVILKVMLGQLLVYLTFGLCYLAAGLFELVGFSLISDLVSSRFFYFVMLPFFFGIAMTILHQQESIITRFRDILLAFCKFLYPIFAVISVSFLIVLPFSQKPFDDMWGVVVGLGVANIVLFNGLYQGGLTSAPYSKWFRAVIYVSFIINFVYSLYVFKYPLGDIQGYGLKPGSFLLIVSLSFLVLYNLLYSVAIFASKKTWLSMIKPANTAMALLIALVFILLSLTWFNVSHISAAMQKERLLSGQEITNPDLPFTEQGYLVGADFKGANLAGKNLSHIDFSYADLSSANLEGANLSFATLQGANLQQANLKSANLDSAQLNEANLSQANLENASLSNASLYMVNLTEAKLSNVNLTFMHGLEQSQVSKACGNDIKLPKHLKIKACR
jgi:hypothetical protein